MEVFPLSHKVEILSVGTELLLGSIANTDAQMLSQGLSALGLNVYWHTVVGDNPQRAREAVAIAKERADIIITTGGLGPTCDDLTKNVLAEAFGKRLYRDEDSVRRLEEFARKRGRTLTENNYQQAMLPEGVRPEAWPHPDGEQLPAGHAPRGLYRAGKRLGLRPRLCL